MATSETMILGFELSHPKIYIICELLKWRKGQTFLIHTIKISIT